MNLFSRWRESRRRRREASERKEYLFSLRNFLSSEGIVADGPGNPTLDIGQALRLADKYGVELHVGMTYADCRAVLPRSRWAGEILAGVRSEHFGAFLANEPHEQIDSIYAFSHEVPEAICKCLRNARIAGVI